MSCEQCNAVLDVSGQYILQHGNACSNCGAAYVSREKMLEAVERFAEGEAERLIHGTGTGLPLGVFHANAQSVPLNEAPEEVRAPIVRRIRELLDGDWPL